MAKYLWLVHPYTFLVFPSRIFDSGWLEFAFPWEYVFLKNFLGLAWHWCSSCLKKLFLVTQIILFISFLAFLAACPTLSYFLHPKERINISGYVCVWMDILGVLIIIDLHVCITEILGRNYILWTWVDDPITPQRL